MKISGIRVAPSCAGGIIYMWNLTGVLMCFHFYGSNFLQVVIPSVESRMHTCSQYMICSVTHTDYSKELIIQAVVFNSPLFLVVGLLPACCNKIGINYPVVCISVLFMFSVLSQQHVEITSML